MKVVVGIVGGLFVLASVAPALAAPGNSGNGGNHGNHNGQNGGGSQGQGGGNGGQGGHGGNGGHGGGHHGGHGGGKGGGVSISAPSEPSVSTSEGSAFTITGGEGQGSPNLAADIKACEMERPGLALGDYRADGSWSFMTWDDTVWPYVYRCMKARGHKPAGPDYSR